MLQILLTLYIVCFSLGAVVLVLSILSFQRSGRQSFKLFTLLFTAAIIYLLADMLKIYEKVFVGIFGGALPIVATIFAGSGNGLLGFTVPLFCYGIVSKPISKPRSLIHGASAVVLIVFGALAEVFPLTVFTTFDAFGIALFLVYGLVIIAKNMRGIENPHLRSLLRIFVVSLPAMLVLMIVQLFVRSLPSAPNFIREYPMAVIGLYLGTETLLIVYALRHLFKMENLTGIVVSSQFVQKYGISPREREIVSMMALGYNNRKIGENLFISTMTVKNHIYHIYQKTGAQNKIQLFNLVKPQK